MHYDKKKCNIAIHYDTKIKSKIEYIRTQNKICVLQYNTT